MRLYPAIRARMGDWVYYIVRMTMREVASEVRLASDLWDDRTLSTAIQRMLDESRVKTQIVNYLTRRDDRFFASLVVAAIGGNPAWKSAEAPIDVGVRAFNDAFGILSFEDDPKYYALDGQHRLKAIKELMADLAGAPDEFDKEQISVIVVMRDPAWPEEIWLRRYRRLFSSLNRYAKPTDRDTNIIMDEDDLFAIVTRRLITDHAFFSAPGREKKSFRVQTKGKNVKPGTMCFTSLQTLYDMNTALLMTVKRKRQWGVGQDFKKRLQVRPDEGEIDGAYEALSRSWDALLQAVPALWDKPAQTRTHERPKPTPDPNDGSEFRDDLRFWPIGQVILAKVARDLLNRGGHGDDADVSAMAQSLAPLANAPWELHDRPWRYLLLLPPVDDSESRGTWRMRSEDRKKAIEVAERILRWRVGLDPLNETEVDELRRDWAQLLLPPQSTTWVEQTWSSIADGGGELSSPE